MPYIPLPEPNLEPPMPQAPALVPAAGLRVDARGLFNAAAGLGEASKLPMIDERPFVAAAGAKGKAMGETMQEAGGVLALLARKRLEALQDRTVQQAKRAYADEKGRAQAYRKVTPDTSTWVSDTQKGIAAVTKRIMGVKGLLPQMLSFLSDMGEEQLRTETILAEEHVAMTEFAATADIYRDSHILAKSEGRYTDAADLAREGGKKRYFAEPEVEEMLKEVAQQEREDQLKVYVAEHPHESVEQLAREDKLGSIALTKQESRKWGHLALTVVESEQQKALQAVVNATVEGGMVSTSQLDAWKGKLSPEAYETLASVFSRHEANKEMNSDAQMERAIAEIETMPAGNDPAALLKRAGIALGITSQFSGSKRNELIGRLTRRLGEGNLPSPIGMALERLNAWAYHDMFGGETEGPKKSGRATAEVRAVREQLEAAHKAGKITTDVDALDFVAMKAINRGWGVATREAERSVSVRNALWRPVNSVVGRLTAMQNVPFIEADSPSPRSETPARAGVLSEGDAERSSPESRLWKQTMAMNQKESLVRRFYTVDDPLRDLELQAKMQQAYASQGVSSENSEQSMIKFFNDELLRLHYPEQGASSDDKRQQFLLHFAAEKFGYEGKSIKDGVFFTLAKKHFRREDELAAAGDMSRIDGIPIDFAWDPAKESLKTTVRVGTYESSTGDLGIESRGKWKDDFKRTYGYMAVNAAWKNAVPARLLTTLAANEVGDRKWNELYAFADRRGWGGSWGPLQISGETAKREGVAFNEEESSHAHLDKPGNNFNIGGRLLKIYLSRLAEDVANGRHERYSNSFKQLATLNYPSSPIFADLKVVREGNPERVFALDPSKGLVRALAAMWNNGSDVVFAEDLAKNNPNAYNHAENATDFADFVDDLMPVFKFHSSKAKSQAAPNP